MIRNQKYSLQKMGLKNPAIRAHHTSEICEKSQSAKKAEFNKINSSGRVYKSRCGVRIRIVKLRIQEGSDKLHARKH